MDATPLPGAREKIMKRSRQRGGAVAAGTSLSSGARQATVAFPSPDFDKLQLVADQRGVSLRNGASIRARRS